MKNTYKKAIYGVASALAIGTIMAMNSPVLAASDLIGYWNFDESSGATATDNSPNGNNGTFTGAGVTHSTLLPPTSCFVNTHSVKFDGGGDYVQIPDNSSMDPASDISISFWMNPDTVTNGFQHIVFKQGPVVTSYGVWLNGDHIYMEDNDNSVRGLNSNAAVTAGAWHYITVTYDGTTQSLYIDGVLDNSQSIPGITLTYTNSPVKVGSGDYNNPFAGYVDDLRIYNRALTSTEVTDLAAGGCGPGVAAAVTATSDNGASSQTAATPTAEKTLTDTGLNITLSAVAALSLITTAVIVMKAKSITK